MTATPENAANSTEEPSVVRNDEAGRYETYLGENVRVLQFSWMPTSNGSFRIP